ncbi:hypothetical protein ACP4OV_031209 [Aristida adscensionis]
MNAVRNLLRFLLISSLACILLLVMQRYQSLCRVEKGEVFLHNGTQVDRSKDKLGMEYYYRRGNNKTWSDDEHKLSELLRKAAMEDKTIIMTFVNEAWTAPGSLMELFLESFRIGVKTAPLLKHLVFVAVDGKAFERCRRLHPLCYALPVNGTNFASEQRFMAKDYLDMMWRRNRFQARILELGYSFVFTDVDIVWFRNPLLRIPVGADIALACDKFAGDNPYDLRHKNANGGFVYAKASARTVAFYKGWYEARSVYPGKNEQELFDRLKQELAARHGVAAQFVDTAYLGTGCDRRRRDFNKLCTFHANCLVGLKPKLEKLRGVLDEWKQFKAANNATLTD